MGRSWYSPAPTAVFAGLGELPPRVAVEGIEVTQSIQDSGNSVPLIAGKRTVVRVYLGVESSALISVRGELSVAPSTAGATIASVNSVQLDPSLNAQLRPKREDAKLSLNFIVPDSLTIPGSRQFQLSRVQNVSTGNDVVIGMGAGRTVSFQVGAPLRIRVVGMRYQNSTGPAIFEPRPIDFDLTRSWLRRAYPTAEVLFSTVMIPANYVWPFTADQINAQLAAIRRLDMSSGGDERTHYFGLVFDGGGSQFMRGKASGIPQTPDPSTVASGPTGVNSFGWDNDGSYGDWYTGHELGHTFGRYHPGFCNGNTSDDPSFPYPNGQLSPATGDFVGFDVGDSSLGLEMKALPGVVWHDVMTYCDNQWLSAYTYEGIRTRILAESALGAASPTGGPRPAGDQMTTTPKDPSAGPNGGAINVVATVNLTRQTGHIDYVQPVQATATGAGMAKGDQPANIVLRLRNASGDALDTQPVELRLGSCPVPGEDLTGLVDAVVTLNPAVHFVDLMLNGKVLSTYAASTTGPSLTSVRTVSKKADNTIELAWDSDHPMASTVTYSVQVSDDAGATWKTIALQQPTPRYSLDLAHLPAAKSLKVRVIASDGFKSSVVSSEEIPLNPSH